MKNRMAHRKTQMKRHMAMKRNAEFQKQLNLTQDQKDQLAKLRTDSRTQAQSIRNDQSLTQDQKKEKIHSLMKDQREKFKTVLTKDQLDKLQSLRKEHQSRNTK
jgi:Spy/CpxP family protein refolding chaperone